MKKFLVVLLAALMLATGTFAAFEKVNTYDNNFSDVKDTNWFAADVKSAYELGFMNGKAEGLFDPNGNVTVAEGITMAARVNAIYNGKEITKAEAPAAAPAGEEIRFDFDSMDGHRLNHAIGDVEDGILVMEPDAPNAGGNYDLGVFMDELSVDASVYKTMTVRMKRDELPNINERRETIEIFFGSEANPTLGDAGNFLYSIVDDAINMDEWYDYTFDMSAADGWKGTIVQIRFDPTNNNGKYYIDSIVLSSAKAAAPAEPKPEKWYDMYVDYAVANGIITKTTFGNYDKNISRADLANLFAKALPESYFNAINDIKGIPDVKKTDKYAKELLMLYKAGVVLGDADGNFNPASDIKRSEVAAIINRVALPESRVKGTVDAVWEEDKPAAPAPAPEVPKADEDDADEEHVATPFDVEFNDASDLDFFAPGEVDSAEIVDGALVMVAKDRGADRMPQYDPRLVMQGVEIDADTYKTIKIRLKAEFIGEVTNGYNTDIYYMTSDDANFSEEKSLHPNLMSVSKQDAEGWYLVTINLAEKDSWKGKVTAFRFDPSNNNGVFTFDYIRFAE